MHACDAAGEEHMASVWRGGVGFACAEVFFQKGRVRSNCHGSRAHLLGCHPESGTPIEDVRALVNMNDGRKFAWFHGRGVYVPISQGGRQRIH
jgi:hypothetical protein